MKFENSARILFRVICAFAALLTCFGLTASAVTVTNTNDSGAGSLRDAIATAVSGDTIDFSLSGCPCVIALTSSELQVLNKELIIAGPGAAQLTISGQNARRVFRIAGASGSVVTISGLRIADGLASNAGGGGVYVENGRLTLINTVVSGNSATGSQNGFGGGVFVDLGASLNVIDSTISNNSSVAGGGGISSTMFTLGAESNILLRNSTISNNTSATGGGVLSGAKTFLTSSGTNYSGNTATGNDIRGGGLFNVGVASVYLGTFSQNTVSGNNSVGGGIASYDGSTLSLERVTITGNSSPAFGGGIDNRGTLTVTESTISSNQAPNGGGIANTSPGTATIVKSTISSNVAAQNGGGVYNRAQIRLVNTTISGNQAGGAAAMMQAAGTSALVSCTIAFNSATFSIGGLLNIVDASTFTVQNSIIAQNAAPSSRDIALGFTSLGFNLIGRSNGGTGFTNGVKNDLVGTDASPLDPLLAPLAQNGGFTLTHLPQPTSPAIDKGNGVFGVDRDQRGFARFVDSAAPNIAGGNNADIGAVEFAATTAAVARVGGRVLTADNRGLRNATVILVDSEGNTRSTKSTTFGAFSFGELEAGETYVLLVRSKNARFAPQIVTVDSDATELNLVETVAAATIKSASRSTGLRKQN